MSFQGVKVKSVNKENASLSFIKIYTTSIAYKFEPPDGKLHILFT